MYKSTLGDTLLSWKDEVNPNPMRLCDCAGACSEERSYRYSRFANT